MKLFVVVATLFLASTCNAGYGAVSTQYHNQDSLGQYSYGYSEPNSQKHETRSANGVTQGGYSYVDGHGIVQSVKYVSDPVHGFQVAGTNLPQGPAPVHAHLAYAAPVVHAHHVSYAAPLAYAAPWAHHVAPVALHHGVPVDTPEVQHAKAEHFAAHAAARANAHHVYRRSAWGYAAPWSHATPQIHNGVPVDTPEVQHAKAEHFAAHSKALAGQHVASAHLGYAPVAHHNGAPIDTPEVQHAKAAHFAAHAAARSGHAIAPAHYAPAHYAPAHYAHHVPVIHNGVPVDTPEVQHAKAAHFAAVAEAHSRSYSAPAAAHAYGGHAYGGHAYGGAQHIPIIHNGVPVETPEVQHAKAAHFAAVAEASHNAHAQSWDNGHHDDGHWDNGHSDNGHWDNGHHDW